MSANESMDDHKLINLVQMNDLLYNKSSPHFKNAAQKREVWANIANELGVIAALCEKRWLSLRERLTKELRKLDCPSGSGSVEISSWVHFDSMQFLRGHLLQRKQRSNFQANDSVVSEVPSSPVSVFQNDFEPLSPGPMYISQVLSAGESYTSEILSPGSVTDAEVQPQPLSANPVRMPPRGRKRSLASSMDDNMAEATQVFKAFCVSMKPPEPPAVPVDQVADNIANVVRATLGLMSYNKKLATATKIMQLLNEAQMEPDN